MSLSNSEKRRYDRQLLIPNWDETCQEIIMGARVFIAGAGGLGSAVAYYLAAAGVGCIRICDNGWVESSNFNRQILYTEEDLRRSKALSAKETLLKFSSLVNVVDLSEKIDKTNIGSLVLDAQVIIDCLDNFETRYLLNEYAVEKSLPFIHAAVAEMSGQLTFIHTPQTPCLKCFFPSFVEETINPIVGATAGVIGCMQALEVLKYLIGIKGVLKNRLLIWEGDIGSFEIVEITKDPSCPICSAR